jgi:outer membrane immunogenic protein
MTTRQNNRLHIGLALLTGIAAVLAFTPAHAEKFNGVYAGGDFGYEGSGRTTKNGWTYGGFAGLNVKLGERFVVGGELRLADSTVKEQLRTDTATSLTVIDGNIGRSIGATARAGWLAGDNTLLFVRGGWENTRFTTVQTRTPKPTGAAVVTKIAANSDSFTAGAGVEHFITDAVSLRLTYDWAENFDRHQVRAGIAFNF